MNITRSLVLLYAKYLALAIIIFIFITGLLLYSRNQNIFLLFILFSFFFIFAYVLIVNKIIEFAGTKIRLTKTGVNSYFFNLNNPCKEMVCTITWVLKSRLFERKIVNCFVAIKDPNNKEVKETILANNIEEGKSRFALSYTFSPYIRNSYQYIKYNPTPGQYRLCITLPDQETGFSIKDVKVMIWE